MSSIPVNGAISHQNFNTMKINNKEVVKVNKTKAKRLFYEGYKTYMIPCKANLASPWISPCEMTLLKYEDKCNWMEIQDFEEIVNSFTYFNCNSELGKYPHFYAEKTHRFAKVRSIKEADECTINKDILSVSIGDYYWQGHDAANVIYEVEKLSSLANVSEEIALTYLHTSY